ncbi:hypothetical protein CYLTODRAFT_459967 [Cylindrobasidium torrendii FP15055 ss-10]|uniref:Uncharacterized protein n=1 Tax=Cylindrobasidium torrendii FP15055 ss-10 TaxID=1314674 RepID=A0A0D7ASX3_9AGAR|nr:hypothetical protein CYLTODRAFT_459967 [Cylindrobasidium torrendii FP15055 ss-10]
MLQLRWRNQTTASGRVSPPEHTQHRLTVNEDALLRHLQHLAAQDRDAVAALVHQFATLVGSIYSRNGDLEGLGFVDAAATPQSNSVVFPLVADLLCDSKVFSLENLRTGPVIPNEHQLNAAHVYQVTSLPETASAMSVAVNTIRNDIGLLSSHLFPADDALQIENRLIDNLKTMDSQLFNLRAQFESLLLSEPAAKRLDEIPPQGPLLQALRLVQHDLPNLESVLSSPFPDATSMHSTSPLPSTLTPFSSPASPKNTDTGEWNMLEGDIEGEITAVNDDDYELLGQEPMSPLITPRNLTSAARLDDADIIVTGRFVACQLEPAEAIDPPMFSSGVKTYAIRDACCSQNCVRKREHRANPMSLRVLTCGSLGKPFDGVPLTTRLPPDVPTFRVGAWRGSVIFRPSASEECYLQHPLSASYYPDAATAAALQHAAPVYEITRLASKITAEMSCPPRLFTAQPQRPLLSHQLIINADIRQAVRTFEQAQKLDQHTLRFKTAFHLPVTQYAIIAPPLDFAAPDLAVQIREPIMDYEQFRIHGMRHSGAPLVEESAGDGLDIQLAYFDVNADGRRTIILNAWREPDSLARLREARKHAARLVEYTALIAQATFFRNAVDDLPHEHPTRHFFYVHCHVLRYLHDDLRDADQGFNVICAHLNPDEEELLQEEVVAPTGAAPFNPLLLVQEDDLLHHVAVVLEHLHCGMLANECRKLCRLPTYAPDDIRALLLTGYLEPADNYDDEGRLFPYLLN